MAGSKFNVQVKPLGTDNYVAWSILVKQLLVLQGLWSVVDPDAEKTENEDKQQNDKALAVITIHLEEFHLQTAGAATSARELWAHFASTFQAKSVARRFQLRQQLLSLKKEPSEPLTKFTERAKSLWSSLKTTGHEMSETELCWSVLSGLPTEYGVIKTILMSKAEDLSLDTILPQLLQVEQETVVEEDPVNIFGAKARVRPGYSQGSKRCYKCGKVGHIRADCPELSRSTMRTVAF